jgi:hypothetical protein
VYGHWKDEWNSDPTKIITDVFYLLVVNGGSAAESGAALAPPRISDSRDDWLAHEAGQVNTVIWSHG